MGVLGKVIDGFLFLSFFSICMIAPLDIPDSVLPNVHNPLYQCYTMISHDYLVLDKPPFFFGLMMLELFYLFPLALLNIYGMLNSKPWFNSTCIIFGSSLLTSTVAMVGDILGSDKPSADLMLMYYSPFIPLGCLAILRGMVSQSPTTANRVVSASKKKA